MINLMKVAHINEVSQKLINGHIDEIGKFPTKLNKEIYAKAQKYAFILDKKQIGYIAYFVSQHPHYDKKSFQDLSYYIDPKYRGYARTVFRLVEGLAKKEGCDIMMLHCTREKEVKFFSILNYDFSHYVMRKEL